MNLKTLTLPTPVKVLIRKSSFFGYTFAITSENDIKPIIQALRRKHKKANHVAYAYRLSYTKNTGEVVVEKRAHDDKEPSRTAGYPLLWLLEQKKLNGILVCVARIYGGIKLGPAGLIKAYRSTGLLALQEREATTQKKEEKNR